MLLVPIPWAGRVWALPFLSALAPSERYAQRHGCRHKPVPLWARQLIRLVHRWLPDRSLVVVGDRGYAALDLLDAVRPVATVITRLRLDARLVAPPPPRAPAPKWPSPHCWDRVYRRSTRCDAESGDRLDVGDAGALVW